MSKSRFERTIYRIDGGRRDTMLVVGDGLDALVGTDSWERAESLLVDMFREYGEQWGAGTYEVVTVATYSNTETCRIQREMPLAPGYARLPYKGGRGVELPIRAFAQRILSEYQGSTYQQVGEHIDVFAKHRDGKYSDDELTEITGYRRVNAKEDA